MQNINQIINDNAIALNYEVVAIENRSGVITIYIDSIDNSVNISIEDCVKLSNHLTRIFEVENIDYQRLQVSTPGIDRPLNKYADYIKFVGHEAIVTFKQNFENKKRFKGVILPPQDENTLALEVEVKNGFATINFTVDEVDKAKLSLDPYLKKDENEANKIAKQAKQIKTITK